MTRYVMNDSMNALPSAQTAVRIYSLHFGICQESSTKDGQPPSSTGIHEYQAMVKKAKVIARNYLNLTTQYDTNNETDVPGKHLDLISSSKCSTSV